VGNGIRRRDFIKTAIATGGALTIAPLQRAWGLQTLAPAAADPTRVKRVLAVFKCHFDAGFIDTQQHVVDRYFQKFFPLAISVAKASREPGQNRYVWTTGSWLLYNYLEQASPADRATAEEAIAAGDLAWHALPFNWQSELMDDSQIAGSLALSRSLDSRFGKVTTGAKMTDVPGHTRGLIAPLVAGGITFLDIGVNGASRPAVVPPLFVWKDSRGNALTVMYHHEYGSVVQVAGSDLAIAIIVRGDNSGPHTPAEIDKIYADLKRQFPNAEVVATGLGEVAKAALPYRDQLPVVTQEIGDTWIYGIPSDPIKVARYREVSRLRQKWIERGAFQSGDKTDLAFLSNLLLEAEHTWGTDTKTWLDFDHYTPDQLQSMLPTKNYQVVAYSWKEKRQDLFAALDSLPETLRQEAETAIAALSPKEPATQNVHTSKSASEIENDYFHLTLDPKTGAIHRLLSKHSGREWASPEHPLALLSYQTLSMKDYTNFFERYIISTADWARKDFGKPKIDQIGAVSRTWYPGVDAISASKEVDGHRIVIASSIKDEDSAKSGLASFPRRFYTEIVLSNAEPAISTTVSWFGKRATRMPESLWLSFNPLTSDPAKWMLEKCSEPVSPIDVVKAGARHMHSVSSGFSCQSGKGTLFVDTIDAPVVALGERSPINFSETDPDLSNGVHCNLFNNAWGTNYIQWFGEDCKLRFRIRET
jgi:hypothetical protein